MVAFLRHCEQQQKFADAEIERIEKRKAFIASVEEQLESYIVQVIEQFAAPDRKGVQRLEGNVSSMRIQKNPDSVLITDLNAIPLGLQARDPDDAGLRLGGAAQLVGAEGPQGVRVARGKAGIQAGQEGHRGGTEGRGGDHRRRLEVRRAPTGDRLGEGAMTKRRAERLTGYEVRELPPERGLVTVGAFEGEKLVVKAVGRADFLALRALVQDVLSRPQPQGHGAARLALRTVPVERSGWRSIIASTGRTGERIASRTWSPSAGIATS